MIFDIFISLVSDHGLSHTTPFEVSFIRDRTLFRPFASSKSFARGLHGYFVDILLGIILTLILLSEAAFS